MAFGNTSFGNTYMIDIVFCIDASSSMQNVMEKVKHAVIEFPRIVWEAFEERAKYVDKIRTKVITFRDFKFDKDALVSSPFYTFPEEEEEFRQCVNGIEAVGGGDEPENGLEALSEAMNSEWTQEGNLRRHIIVLFTDASAVEFEDSKKDHPQYPAIVPANLAELQDWWEEGTPNGSLQNLARRLILFAPEVEPWYMAVAVWNLTCYTPYVISDDVEIEEFIRQHEILR